MGRSEAIAIVWDAFRDAFTAQGQDFDSAWSSHLRAMDAVDRRREWDRTASNHRSGDHIGTVAA
jgi:hypothetical protein